MKPLFVLASLMVLAVPAAARDVSQCQKLHAEHDTAFKTAIMQAAGNLDKKARCVAVGDALSILDKIVEVAEACPAVDPGVKDMVSRRKATHARHCGA